MILGYNWYLNNPKGWLMSEKLDGVRAYWTGERLFTRDYKAINAPDWFLSLLPRGVALDGELWHGRGNYRETMKLFQMADPSAIWETVRYGIFDAPDVIQTIEQRLDRLASMRFAGPLFTLAHTPCRSLSHLRSAFAPIFNAGGEGLVLRKARSLYTSTRTTEFLKVKHPW